ncbi:hypothetical protein HA402_011792 [Bradysia odoriphaga]|nr:hypothetical protein HA402_011792 [Bradysia odoriphaga]
MTKPILYSAELSPAVRAVWLTARALNLELENRTINLFAGDQLKPEFLKINPQHTVPTLDDNGLIIWDSHAICTYLIDKYGKNDHLYPKDICVRARIDQRLYFNVGVAFASFQPIVEAVFFKGATKFPAEAVKRIHSTYSFLELFLKDDLFMVGNTITVADYCLVATISTGQLAVPITEESYPKLAAWFGRMKDVPFYEESNGQFVEKFRQFIEAKLEANKTAADAAKNE